MSLLIKNQKDIEFYFEAKLSQNETQEKVYTGYKNLVSSLENVLLQQILTGEECQNIVKYLVVTPCSP